TCPRDTWAGGPFGTCGKYRATGTGTNNDGKPPRSAADGSVCAVAQRLYGDSTPLFEWCSYCDDRQASGDFSRHCQESSLSRKTSNAKGDFEHGKTGYAASRTHSC